MTKFNNCSSLMMDFKVIDLIERALGILLLKKIKSVLYIQYDTNFKSKFMKNNKRRYKVSEIVVNFYLVLYMFLCSFHH